MSCVDVSCRGAKTVAPCSAHATRHPRDTSKTRRNSLRRRPRQDTTGRDKTRRLVGRGRGSVIVGRRHTSRVPGLLSAFGTCGRSFACLVVHSACVGSVLACLEDSFPRMISRHTSRCGTDPPGCLARVLRVSCRVCATRRYCLRPTTRHHQRTTRHFIK